MSTHPLLEVAVESYRSLANVQLALGPVNVLVGPNGAGKSNLLDVFRFVGDAARNDLVPAIRVRGGFWRVAHRGQEGSGQSFRLRIKAIITRYASRTAPDEYELRVRRVHFSTVDNEQRDVALRRSEKFTFKRRGGRGRRLTLSGTRFHLTDEEVIQQSLRFRTDSLLLATLPRLADSRGGNEVARFAELFTTFRVFDIDVAAARRPSDVRSGLRLESDASNLAAFLAYLHKEQDTFSRLERDARLIVPGLERILLRPVGGAREAVVVELKEKGLRGRTPLADASYGTIRTLALLALLYDPMPPKLTCVEEIDHGIHPWAFDRLADLVREASERTQFILATHSPAFVNRLKAHEMIVCERDPETGASRIPAIPPKQVARMIRRAGDRLQLGELWFSGSLGGVPREAE